MKDYLINQIIMDRIFFHMRVHIICMRINNKIDRNQKINLSASRVVITHQQRMRIRSNRNIIEIIKDIQIGRKCGKREN